MLAKYWRPILLVLLPFAAGYYISYFFRTINALISGNLIKDFGLDASHLATMTSAYFLSFAAIQLPLGVLLDRFGPRRVQSGLLLVAAAGAELFARAEHYGLLVTGRALIGFGVAGSLIAGLKAIVMWFPKDRISLVNGCFIMLGTLGAVAATSPAEWLLPYLGWRGLIESVAVITAITAVATFSLVPDPLPESLAPSSRRIMNLNTIYGDPRFWRLAPLSTMCISTAWALQSLWAAPWLSDVEGLMHADVVAHLFVMAVALSTGALLLGLGADQPRRGGIRPETTLCSAALFFIGAELLLIMELRSLSYASWAVIASVGAATVLSYSAVAEYFPKEVAGQANAALNVLHIGGAFFLQQAIGVIVANWPCQDGHYPSVAYKVAFALVVVLQLAAIMWFMRWDQKIAAVLRTYALAHLGKRYAIRVVKTRRFD